VIPSEKVRSVIAQLKEKGSVTRGWLAMQFQSVTAEIADTLELAEPLGDSGYRSRATQGGAAEAGLKTGDLIKSIDGAQKACAPNTTSGLAAIEIHPTGHG
jgi:serine protease Do